MQMFAIVVHCVDNVIVVVASLWQANTLVFTTKIYARTKFH